MAVGDVVSAQSTSGADLVYQPASGVEVLVSSVERGTGASAYGIFDGTNISFIQPAANTNLDNIKIFINNTRYLKVSLVASTFVGFSGVQIK